MHTDKSLLLGQTYCRALSLQFPTTFRYQFALSPSQRELPGFAVRRFGGGFLHSCPELAICEIQSIQGTPLGLILGHAIDDDGTRLHGTATLPLSTSDPDLAAKLQDWVTWLSGRFLVLLDVPGPTPLRRLYPDPAGSYGAVYDPDTGLVASSLLLALNRDLDPTPGYRLNDQVLGDAALAKLLPSYDPALPAGGFGFGDTPDRRVRRMMANRYVDLTDFTVHRFWPGSDDLPELSVTQAAEIIVRRMRLMMSAFCTDFSGYFAISGGRDSRMLLACAPDLSTSDVTLYCYSNNYITTLDLRIAQELADCVDRPLLAQLPLKGPKATLLANPKRAARLRHRFALASGLAHMGDDWWQRGYARQLKSGGLWLRGNFLEIVTARVWPKRAASRQAPLEHALERTRVAIGDAKDRAQKMARLQEWQNSFAFDDARHLHDLTYLDLTLAPAQTNFLGFNHLFYVAPANDRQIFAAAMQVPGQLRSRGELYNEIMRQANPRMGAVPLAGSVAFQSRKRQINARTHLEELIQTYRATISAP